MSSTADDFGFSIDLTVRNEWKNIDLLRTSVQNCFIAVFADLDGCHAIAMVTGELLENALKYGDWASGDRAMFRLRVHGSEGNIEVSVQNPLKQDDTNAQSLHDVDRVDQQLPEARAGVSRAHAADRAGQNRRGTEPARSGAHRVRGQLPDLREDRAGTVTVTARCSCRRHVGAKTSVS